MGKIPELLTFFEGKGLMLLIVPDRLLQILEGERLWVRPKPNGPVSQPAFPLSISPEAVHKI